MNKIFQYTLIYILSVFFSSISQIMLKRSALKHYDSKLKEYLNPLVVLAYMIFFISNLLTIFAYKFVPISMGPILESSGYIFIGILSYIFLKERLNRRKLFGLVFIFLGILIFSFDY